MFEEWIARCEETIKSFLAVTKIDSSIVQKLLDNEQTEHWRDILTISKGIEPEICISEKKKQGKENSVTRCKREKKVKNEQKLNGLIMGKLHDDMVFLDKLANHPALQKNLLVIGVENKDKQDVENVLKDIRGAALDGLTFLQVRKSFWETSEPPIANVKKRKCVRRSRSDGRRYGSRRDRKLKRRN